MLSGNVVLVHEALSFWKIILSIRRLNIKWDVLNFNKASISFVLFLAAGTVFRNNNLIEKLSKGQILFLFSGITFFQVNYHKHNFSNSLNIQSSDI